MSTSLVTGASAGIGAAFARHLAARGDDLVLVARDEARLTALAQDLIDEFEIDVEVLRADLNDLADIDRVAARLEDTERPVELLINNAGFGVHSAMLEPNHEEISRALRVMCHAVISLDGAAARAMKARGHGGIIVTGSSAGWLTTGLYSAVKAFVNNYTESLAAELAGTGVRVTVLAPGWVKTEFHQRAGIKANLPGPVWIDVDELVAAALRDNAKGRVWSIPTRRWAFAGFLAMHVAPRAALRAASAKLNHSRK